MKINRKILFTVLILFTLSNTGLPVVFHVCSMMSEVTLESCGMCEAKLKDMHQGHYHPGHSPNEKLARDTSDCCSYKTVERAIKDNFLQVMAERVTLQFTDNIVPEILDPYDLSLANKNILSLFNGPPPGPEDNHIYLNNSILLI